MRRISGSGGRTVVAILLLSALLAFMLSPCLAETATPAPVSNQTALKPDQQSPALVQCDLGLALPLLLAGLATLGSRAKAHKKK